MRKYFCYKQVLLILTQDCNLNCSYCFEKNAHRKEYMSDEVLNQVIEQIKKDGHYLCDDIEFFGGEPMLAQDKMIKIITTFKDSICYTVMTNGTIAPTKEFIEQCRPYANNITFFLSFDGLSLNYQRKSNTRAIQNTYHTLKENGFEHIFLIATYTKEFSQNVEKHVIQLAKSGSPLVRIKRLIHIAQYTPEYLKPIADSINKLCLASLYVKFKYNVQVNLPDNINYPVGVEGFARRSYMCDTFTLLCTGVGVDGKLYMCEPLAALQQNSYADSIKDWRKKPQYFSQLEFNKPYTICQTDLKSDAYYDKKTIEGQKLYNNLQTKIERLRMASYE